MEGSRLSPFGSFHRPPPTTTTTTNGLPEQVFDHDLLNEDALVGACTVSLNPVCANNVEMVRGHRAQMCAGHDQPPVPHTGWEHP